MKKIEKSIEFAGRKLTLTTGHIAQQADSAVFAQYGETVVMATVVAADLKVDMGYFPLVVEYQEKLFAGGRIKGSRWVKREGRPTDDEILVARLIDRTIRPLFPKEYMKDVQLILTVLSVDMENSPEFVAGVAASAVLTASKIPWEGPASMIQVGRVDGKLVTNPTEEQLKTSDLDLFVSSTDKAIVMIEAGGNQIAEDAMAEAIEYGQKQGKAVLDLVNDLAKAVGAKKEEVEAKKTPTAIIAKVEKLTKGKLAPLADDMATKKAGYPELDAAKKAVVDEFEDEEKATAGKVFEELFEANIRETILSGSRPDGRKHDELRALSAEVGVLPRTHGSAIFQRGQTQAMTVATLGAPSLELAIETPEGEEVRHYFHHYSMPPYSTGETGRVGSPKRREIGHGALAERALLPVVPSVDEFPYTIHVVTEILSSNGSTSMASTCGSTLSLMDAGVPLKAPIAGIAMGVVIENSKKFAILTDIVGIEDGNGDMDFKVAGSSEGITALQLDVKTLNLTAAILKQALTQAKKARLEILSVMTKALKAPRETVSKYAPKIKVVHIEKEKIGELIGPGGKTIKGIMASTGAQIDVEDDGSVFISSTDGESMQKAVDYVEGMTKEPVVGEIYEGEVKRVESFGAFVEFLPMQQGMVHVSDMSEEFVKDAHDVVEVGQKVQVRMLKKDELGRINLSMLLDPSKDAEREEAKKQAREQRDNGRGGDRGRGGRGYDRNRNDRGGRSFDRNGGRGYDRNRNDRGGRSFDRNGGRGGRNDRGRNDRSGDKRSSGPHFPATRLLDDVQK